MTRWITKSAFSGIIAGAVCLGCSSGGGSTATSDTVVATVDVASVDTAAVEVGTPVTDAVVVDSGLPSAEVTPDTGPDTAAPASCKAKPPPCVDAMILDLSLHADKKSTGAVTTTKEGDDFVTVIDATAGGFNQSSKNPWVYVAFTSEGAKRVELDDESALESMDWDLSLRRFILRLNGGDSGPSCVGAVSFLEKTYADLTSVPAGLKYKLDDYYTDSCSIVNDSSGLPGSPQVALAPWWSYPGCVSTTQVPHLVRLGDGRVIKLLVEQYYKDAAHQKACDTTQAAPAGAVAAVFTLRWRFMP